MYDRYRNKVLHMWEITISIIRSNIDWPWHVIIKVTVIISNSNGSYPYIIHVHNGLGIKMLCMGRHCSVWADRVVRYYCIWAWFTKLSQGQNKVKIYRRYPNEVDRVENDDHSWLINKGSSELNQIHVHVVTFIVGPNSSHNRWINGLVWRNRPYDKNGCHMHFYMFNLE